MVFGALLMLLLRGKSKKEWFLIGEKLDFQFFHILVYKFVQEIDQVQTDFLIGQGWQSAYPI